ncbi:MAG: SurA N-terminal domain-containing protein [Alphaproteobacteria bacterium]
MRAYIRTVCFLCLAFLMTMPVGGRVSYAAVQEIVAVVNDDVISGRDLQRRLKLIMGSSGLPNKPEIRQKLRPQIMENLINEKIMLQEARKARVDVTQAEIDKGFLQIASQNKFKPDQFKAVLKRNGIDVGTMQDQIRAQIAWSKVVQKRLRPRVVISDRDVEDAYERIQSKIGTTEYLAAEILLPIIDGKNEKEVKQLADRLVREIRSGKASFFKLAQQFSGAAGASKGGDTGWMQEAQIQQEVLSGLQKVKKNQVTSPIKTLNGYHLFFLRDTRILNESTMPSRDQIQYNLGAARLEKLQTRHLMDLRAASFIDIRQ